MLPCFATNDVLHASSTDIHFSGNGLDWFAQLGKFSGAPNHIRRHLGIVMSFAAHERTRVMATSVLGLFMQCRISQVVWLVVAIIVDSVERVTGFAKMVEPRNMVIKRHEVALPFIANRYAAPAVVFVCAAIRIGAAIDNRIPDIVRGMIAKTVDSVGGYTSFCLEATARSCIACSQVITQDNRVLTAFTATQPRDLVSSILRMRPNHDKATKSLPGKIDAFFTQEGVVAIGIRQGRLWLRRIWGKLHHVEKLLSAFGQAWGGCNRCQALSIGFHSAILTRLAHIHNRCEPEYGLPFYINSVGFMVLED